MRQTAGGPTDPVVDPRRSETAAVADRHLAIEPGGDAFLLFALVNVLFAEGVGAARMVEIEHAEDAAILQHGDAERGLYVESLALEVEVLAVGLALDV